jgi:ABC-type cobalamin/Fe3+-siderophores transport system ATPase subunit
MGSTIFKIIVKTSEMVGKVDPTDFLTQDMIKDVFDIVKEVIIP